MACCYCRRYDDVYIDFFFISIAAASIVRTGMQFSFFPASSSSPIFFLDSIHIHILSISLSLSLSLSTLPFYSVAIHFTSTILLLFRCMPSGDFFSSSKKVNEILFHSTFDHCQPIRLGRCYCNLLFN